MNHEDRFFNALIEYIDARIDKKISDRHDDNEDQAFLVKVMGDSAKEELKQALGDLSRTLFFGQPLT